MTLQQLLNDKNYYLESDRFQIITDRNIQEDTEFKLIFSKKYHEELNVFLNMYLSEGYFLTHDRRECFIPLSEDKKIELGCPIIRGVEYGDLDYNDENYKITCNLTGTVLNAESFELIDKVSEQYLYSPSILSGPVGTGLYKSVSVYKM